MNDEKAVRREVVQLFSKRGLSLRKEAANRMIQFYIEVNGNFDWDQIVNEIKQQQQCNIISLEAVETVLTARIVGFALTEHLKVIDSYDDEYKKYVYNEVEKSFVIDNSDKLLFINAHSKINLLRERFIMVRERLLRNELFSPLPPVAPTDVIKNKISMQLTPIKGLIGTDSNSAKYVIGILSQLQEGKYYLEDLNSSVPIDLSGSSTLIASGLFTESSIVVADGVYMDGVFKINTLGLPPPESRAITMQMFPQLNFYNPNISYNSDVDYSIIIISDLFLDRYSVFTKLETLFDAMEASPPTMFIFMGSFISVSGESLNFYNYQNNMTTYFNRLADLIGKYSSISQTSQFVFAAGPNDITSSRIILPRAPLSEIYTKKLKTRIKNIRFVSNPFRIRLFDQEYVFFRENLLQRLRRHCILQPSLEETADINHHLVKTLCDQAHLCPLPLSVQPIYWAFDYALRLNPLPNLLMIADSCSQYTYNYEGVHCFNPGSFGTDYSFVLYRCNEGKLEFSRIDS